MATRQPETGPILDQLAVVAFADPEPATIRHLQRIDRRLHALYTAWGGGGFWVPCHMDNSETPDEMVVPIPIPSGVEYFEVRALVSQRDKTTPKAAKIVLQSGNTSDSVTITFAEFGGGDTLEGAIEVFADDYLQCRSGLAWSWGDDEVTITFDIGTGKLWGLLFQPVHLAQTV